MKLTLVDVTIDGVRGGNAGLIYQLPPYPKEANNFTSRGGDAIGIYWAKGNLEINDVIVSEQGKREAKENKSTQKSQ